MIDPGASTNVDGRSAPRFRFSLLGLLALVSAVCLVLSYPRYFLLVAVLFVAVMSVLSLIGALLGPLPAEKRRALEAGERTNRRDSSSEFDRL